jgi:hypothetical protein
VKIHGGGWQKWIRGSVPFILIEGDRRAIIDAEHARWVMTADAFDDCKRANATAEQTAILDRAGVENPPPPIPGEPWSRTYPWYRLSEWTIDTGDRLAVVGTGVREPDLQATGDYREQPTLIRISGTPERPIQMTNELDD